MSFEKWLTTVIGISKGYYMWALSEFEKQQLLADYEHDMRILKSTS